MSAQIIPFPVKFTPRSQVWERLCETQDRLLEARLMRREAEQRWLESVIQALRARL